MHPDTSEEVKEIVENAMLGLKGECNLDDDENQHSIPLKTKVKTVFGLPPLVFAKPF